MDMLKFDLREEIFLDAAESFLSEEEEESFSVSDGSESDHFSYEIWSNDLRSVKERREIFLKRMGLFEESYSTDGVGKVVKSTEDAVNSHASDENLACSEPIFIVKECGHEPSTPHRETSEHFCATEQFMSDESKLHIENDKNINLDKKLKDLWKSFMDKTQSRKYEKSKAQKLLHKAGEVEQMKVEKNRKKFRELTALYADQEISAHKGLIITMKFSPDGQYLATGGEDGVLCVWGITTVDSSCITSKCNFQSHRLDGNSSFIKKKSIHAPVVIPEKIVQISESPLHEFHGHGSDILDIAWSTSNKLLSASKDNTVRLWDLNSDKCQSIFLHCDYVTCIQFNPQDENYFTSGSVDGKLRVWSIRKNRVVKWADVHDIITVVCHRPNAKGIVTGSLSGVCRFYEVSGDELLLDTEICISGKRKSGNKITGIQFLENISQRVMVTCEDSKIHILDGLDVIHKYKGPTRSGSQTSASLAPSGRHILSVGEDSRIYMWNFGDQPIQSLKSKKSTRSCEHFFSESVSVALPWPGIGAEAKGVGFQEPCNRDRDSEQFSLSSWFSINMSLKSSVTWPEEKLPSFDMMMTYGGEQGDQEKKQPQNGSGTWGLVIVTAGWDGMIRTFHNYGLPIKT